MSVPEAASDLLLEKMPSGQFVEPSHLADTVAFLCGDAAAQMTGSHILLDGGWTAQ